MDLKALWASLPRALKIYLAAAGAVSVAGLAGVTAFAAGSPSPSPSASSGKSSAYCDAYTGHVPAVAASRRYRQSRRRVQLRFARRCLPPGGGRG